ncbi:MAG: hypothetical protein HYS51_01340 [Candidatus Zambryskibacteria bacterium]|nr:hypothetical protein [Candidatus Zambryskibacteria bacterium]
MFNHHANLLIGAAEETEKLLKDFKGSPDFFIFKNATFGIDEARELILSAGRKSFGQKKVYLIAPQKITLEAQNALLKTFEDPVPETYFFLAVKDESLIIPTLRSRMHITCHLAVRQLSNEAKKFIEFSIKERIAFVKKFIDDEKNLSDFLDELLFLLRREEIYKLRLFADDRSASARLILEHLALVLK